MATVTLDLDRRAPHLLHAGTDPGGTASLPRLPRIIVRDGMGRVLETDTSYQRTINAGRLRIARGSTDLAPEEWRLPHAPVPFKPDYSRVGPPVKKGIGIGDSRKTKEADSSHGVSRVRRIFVFLCRSISLCMRRMIATYICLLSQWTVKWLLRGSYEEGRPVRVKHDA